MTGIRVTGIGLTRFGEHSKRAGREVFAEVGQAAGDEAGGDASVTRLLYCGFLEGEGWERYDQQEPLTCELAVSTPRRSGLEDGRVSSGAGDWQTREYSRTSRPLERN